MRATSLVAALVAVSALPALSVQAAGTAVQVRLEDASLNGSLEGMRIKLDRDTVKTGPVTFRVTNESKALVHELIVVQTDLDVSDFPYDPVKGTIDERKVKSLGEVSELKPGKSGKLTVNLKPGPYLLMCNQPGHWHAGMWTKFTVTS
jgi:uncharacterized cupredoxin-like copper-binding protein